jgi:hypothetical protein
MAVRATSTSRVMISITNVERLKIASYCGIFIIKRLRLSAVLDKFAERERSIAVSQIPENVAVPEG